MSDGIGAAYSAEQPDLSENEETAAAPATAAHRCEGLDDARGRSEEAAQTDTEGSDGRSGEMEDSDGEVSDDEETAVYEENDIEYDEESEGEGEDEEEEGDLGYTPEAAATTAGVDANDEGLGAIKPQKPITVDGKPYPAAKFVRNSAFYNAIKKLNKDSKATFVGCQTISPHNVLQCRFIHFANRAVLVGDRYVRVHMFVENEGKRAMLSNPGRSLGMEICREEHASGPASCSKLHLLPDIVFIGVPGLRTAYFASELHHNLGFKKTLEEPWETQCGTWCRAPRSHVITTCKYLHQKLDNAYTEKPRPPHRPTALIPAHTPRRPPQEHDAMANKARRGGRGRGRGRGGGGRGGRGGTLGRARGVVITSENLESALPGMHEAATATAASKAAAAAARKDRFTSGSTVLVKNDPVLGTLKVSNDRLTSLMVPLVAVAVVLVVFIVGKSFIDAPDRT